MTLCWLVIQLLVYRLDKFGANNLKVNSGKLKAMCSGKRLQQTFSPSSSISIYIYIYMNGVCVSVCLWNYSYSFEANCLKLGMLTQGTSGRVIGGMKNLGPPWGLLGIEGPKWVSWELLL